ncbi:T9SS type A sorting domain-containing protein [uncultured Chryseobacterium sp.]|uniref:T9SS type A sorting domain-containing protein n=1 Tax=uncultured Chryseobacterium sp. TaxID=259322 RepID=UPI0025FCB086|nr:T9SS type A sorting domain-containing protein [uncultured Chryseobacterium sp.]
MKQTFLLLFGFITLLVKSQMTVGFKDFKVNGNEQSINSPINLWTNSSANVKFTITYSKSSTYVVGNCTVFVRSYNSNGQYTDLITPINTYFADSVTSFATAIDTDIYANNITFNSGNYLVVEVVRSGGGGWSSPKVDIVKTPTFTLNPVSVAIPCGSANPVTFTCNSNTEIGAFSYKWNVGTGWSRDGNPVSGSITTNTNSLTLTPTNPTVLPSGVSVDVTWNSNYSFTRYCEVKRQAFDNSNSLQITGSDITVCTFPTTLSYNINAANGDSVSWTSSDSTIGELQNTSGTSVNVIIKRQGEITLTAVVTNSCGQNKTVSRKIWAGTPLVYMPNVSCGNPYDSVCFNSNYNVQTGQYSNIVVDALGFDATANPNTDFEWEKISGPFTFVSYGNGNYSNVSNNGNKVTGRMAIMYITSGYNYIQVRARAKNSCGWGPWKSILFQSGGSRMSMEVKKYMVSPNPASDFVHIALFDKADSQEPNGGYAELYNASGNKVGKTDLENNSGKISVMGLIKGIYTLKIYSGKIQENHQLIVK